MPLLRLDDVSLAFGHHALLDRVQCEIRRGERVCLIGRNGEGKSSLLRLIEGVIAPDDGEVWVRPGIRVAALAQEVARDIDASVRDVVTGGLHAGSEAAEGWHPAHLVDTVLSRLGLDGSVQFTSLSGGWRRRAMLARALVAEPDLLLLDEPTNHLDIEAITWIEDFLAEYTGAVLFVTHDRAFLQRLATRIIELDRGNLTSWPCGYADYLQRKEQQLAAEARHDALFDKRLSQEETWIRQGIKARRTRNEGRVRALEVMREQRRQRRDRIGTVRMQLDEGDVSGRLVFEARRVAFGYGERAIVQDFSGRILRGDRIGIIGPNGAGKSTLIRLLLGELEPASGSIRQGTRVQVAYFDQQREQLDPEVTVMDSLGTSRSVTIDGRTRHVAGYLQDFLFPSARLLSPVSALSGGERNRLLLARLFARPANVLIMDEPTNDLDVETLELLEDLLVGYQGTLLLVSHDRAFLDRVVTSTLVFEGDGRVAEYVGGYSDWLRQRPQFARSAGSGPKATQTGSESNAKGNRASSPDLVAAPRKLSYKEQRELAALPALIERIEAEHARLQEISADPAFYRQPRDEVTASLARLQSMEEELAAAYARWEALEAAGCSPCWDSPDA